MFFPCTINNDIYIVHFKTKQKTIKYSDFSCHQSDLTRVISLELCIYIASHAEMHAYFIFRILLSTWERSE